MSFVKTGKLNVSTSIGFLLIYHQFKIPPVSSFTRHRQWKGWGYRAVAPPDFKGTPYKKLKIKLIAQ